MRKAMEGAPENTPTRHPPRSGNWRDVQLLLLLLLLAGGIRAWLIGHTEVMARDGVGFVRYAWQLQSQPWPDVLRENPHPPLYPLTVLALSFPVRHFLPDNDPVAMQLSAQLVTALAGGLLVIPMFFLGRELFDRRVGFGAALLFQCLPVGARLLSDAMSEGIFLLLIATALLLSVRAFRTGSATRFGLIGLCGGLAYLARPEGALVVVATGLVLLGLQAAPAQRRSWRQVVTCGASLILAAVAVGSPYAAVIQRFSNKVTTQSILQNACAEPPARLQTPASWPACATGLTAALATYDADSLHWGFVGRQLWCLGAVGREIIKGYHYLAWVPALAGLWWFRGRFREEPAAWVVWLLVLLHGVGLWRVAHAVGYIADRHSLLIVMSGLFWAVAAVGKAGDWLATVGPRCFGRPVSGSAWSLALLLGLVGTGLPKTLEPLHSNRAGFHAAGLWLAAHAQPGDRIMDPFCWSEYYAGQVFREAHYRVDFAAGPLPRYVVLGGTHNEHERLPLIPWARTLAVYGTKVYHWPNQPLSYKAEEVEIYQLPGPSATR
jgi:hypothetical protein